jgi:GSCFA family
LISTGHYDPAFAAAAKLVGDIVSPPQSCRKPVIAIEAKRMQEASGGVFDAGVPNHFGLIQGVTRQIAHQAWYRGEHCNFNATKEDLAAPGAIERHVAQGWLPKTPFITRSRGITAFGSCFAQHISEYLSSKSYNLLTDKTRLDLDSYIIRCGEGITNTFAIRQQFEWAFRGLHFDEDLWFASNGELAPYRENVREETAGIFRHTDIFIITVGLSEVWYSKRSGNVFWRAIPISRFDPREHGFRLSSVAENFANLQAIVAIIREHRPEAHVIFTLSPIPLHATFRPVSCMTANSVSKAILRVAVDELMRECSQDERLFYFPAYEIVKEFFVDAYLEDNRHVRPEVLAAVMQTFERAFCC